MSDFSSTLTRKVILFRRFCLCDSETITNIPKMYCMHFYSCEYWDLHQDFATNFKIAWLKIKRRF